MWCCPRPKNITQTNTTLTTVILHRLQTVLCLESLPASSTHASPYFHPLTNERHTAKTCEPAPKSVTPSGFKSNQSTRPRDQLFLLFRCPIPKHIQTTNHLTNQREQVTFVQHKQRANTNIYIENLQEWEEAIEKSQNPPRVQHQTTTRRTTRRVRRWKKYRSRATAITATTTIRTIEEQRHHAIMMSKKQKHHYNSINHRL